MWNRFQSILSNLLTQKDGVAFTLFDPDRHFCICPAEDEAMHARALNAAFLIALVGRKHPRYEQAKVFLTDNECQGTWKETAGFYQQGLDLIRQEILQAASENADFAERLRSLASWTEDGKNLKSKQRIDERIWSLFFPEASGIRGRESERIQALRQKRLVTISQLNPNPLISPAEEILFTSNVLLTLPSTDRELAELSIPDDIKDRLKKVSREPQCYWYDHPIQIGVSQDKNEVIYGLRHLAEALAFEKRMGTCSRETKITCVLSVSVTHKGLQNIAKDYLESEFARASGLDGLELYIFTEADTNRLVEDVLFPAARHVLGNTEITVFDMFGVDGAYGRHYSFLKAIAAFWQVFIAPEVRATFKIDLDQVFPQQELLRQTGASIFEHFKTPLWGASGVDSSGRDVELGMIAGALVNESDMDLSLFTPDVRFPERAVALDEHVFFSQIPQALSTEAEMMTRYDTPELDGSKACIQRVHVTGGTNGILIDSLRRHCPFTPSFFGRAEDQAYILSTFPAPEPKLAYVHKDGLIMRHDKQAFAQDAIQAAQVGKWIGDYVRLLYYSAYARVLSEDIQEVKDVLDPFTGCFISRIPITAAYLRFGLKAASLFDRGEVENGLAFVHLGARRISRALAFINRESGQLRDVYERERVGWEMYYEVLSAAETALSKGDTFMLSLRERATEIVEAGALRPE
ncbi:MAG: hypothetical protein MUO76_17505 [Anaerolineaceae bacterium]|nr:hypothetical protein [Anaerolineaceae bacterium]